jgi:hypothetical protein
MLNELILTIKRHRSRQYMVRLVDKGLKLGKNTSIMDRVLLPDPRVRQRVASHFGSVAMAAF